MKIFILALSALFMVSCVSTKYNVYQDHNNFQKVYAGTKYTVFDKNDRKIYLNVTSVENDSIKGIRKNLPFVIAKNDIKEIKKNKNGATIALIGGSVIAVGGTIIMVSAMKAGADAFGEIIGGIH